MSSNWQRIWATLCDFGTRSRGFEIEETLSRISEDLSISTVEARREVDFLLDELSRLPEGRQYFEREGDAVVPLPEFQALPESRAARLQAYPFEL